MSVFQLPKSGGMARIEILDDSALPNVMALQQATCAALPPNKKAFIRPEGTAFFQNLLTRITGLMVGVYAGNNLIAQMAIVGPMELREAIAMRLITRNDIPFHHAALTDNVVVLKGMSSHPEWRGNDLGKNLLLYALDLPVMQIADHVFTQISVGNKRSWDSFARQNFGIVAAAYDPDDHQPRFVFQRPTFGFDFAPAIIADEVDPISDFSAIMALTQREALIGIYDDEAADKLNFMRSHDVSHIVPAVANMYGRR